jgi:hypothetical protein
MENPTIAMETPNVGHRTLCLRTYNTGTAEGLYPTCGNLFSMVLTKFVLTSTSSEPMLYVFLFYICKKAGKSVEEKW